MAARPTVAVVGAGFSGLLTALRLLAAPDGPAVRLIERRGAFAQGVAYSTLEADHLLNVRAANMSAFAEDPGHFLRWLTSRGFEGVGNLFAPRRLYGEYLRAMIHEAVGAADAGRLILEADAAVGVRRLGVGWTVEMAMGRSFEADAVVLAMGNQTPTTPRGAGDAVLAAPAYVADPWSLSAEALPDEGLVVLLGTGLSMVDVALQIHRMKPALRLLAVSRRGLLPRVHLADGPLALEVTPPADVSPARLLEFLRRRSSGLEWRAVIDGFRAHVHDIWRGWSLAERRRFLRHARPWWDVHRHRMAPQVADKLSALIAGGVLEVAAGRIQAMDVAPDGLDVGWTPKGAAPSVTSRAALVVNCTGPNADPTASADALLTGLIERGDARVDPCGLGLDVDPDARLLDATGQAHDTLFAVGPITRGASWEITSVPDIRLQAARCAASVVETLGARAI